MIHMIVSFLAVSVAVYLMALIVPGIKLKGFKSALAVAAVYGLLNFVLFRLLIFITFPLLVLKYITLGIVGVLINAVLLVVTDKLLEGFELSGFGSALLAALGISAINLLMMMLPF